MTTYHSNLAEKRNTRSTKWKVNRQNKTTTNNIIYLINIFRYLYMFGNRWVQKCFIWFKYLLFFCPITCCFSKISKLSIKTNFLIIRVFFSFSTTIWVIFLLDLLSYSYLLNSISYQPLLKQCISCKNCYCYLMVICFVSVCILKIIWFPNCTRN